jgi:hypothetical protein
MIRIHDVKLDVLNQERLVRRFEALARKGWRLNRVGDFFFHFKKAEPKDLHYYIDFNRVTPEYAETLKAMGYHHIDAWRTMHYYCSEKNLPPLDSDPMVMSMSVREFIDPKNIALILICAGIQIVYGWMLALPFEWYSFYTGTLQFVFSLSMYAIAFILILDAIGDLLIRHAFAKMSEGIPVHRNRLLFFLRMTSVIAGVLAAFLCVLLIVVDCQRPLVLLLDLAWILLLYVIRAVFNHKTGSIADQRNRYAFNLVLFLVLFGGDLIYLGLTRNISEQKIQTELTPYGSFADPNEYVVRTSPFLTITEFFDPAKGTYEEIIADCRNEKTAQVFFEGLVRNHAAMNVDGYFTLGNDLSVSLLPDEIWSFDQAVAEADLHEKKGDQEILKLQGRMYARKGTGVVCIHLPGKDEMDAVKYYLQDF